jgi:hypothetical protein
LIQDSGVGFAQVAWDVQAEITAAETYSMGSSRTRDT